MSAIKANSIESTLEENKLTHGDIFYANQSSFPTQPILSNSFILEMIVACVEYDDTEECTESKKRTHQEKSESGKSGSSDAGDSDYVDEEEESTKRVKQEEDGDFVLGKKSPAKKVQKKTRREYKPWTKEEERILLEEAAKQENKKGKSMKWEGAVKRLPGRTNKDCSNKYKQLMKKSC